MSDELFLRRTELDDDGLTLFDRYTKALKDMGTANLGANTFNETFKCVANEKGRLAYLTKPGGADFTANIIAEIGSESQGTWMRSYPKKNPPNLVGYIQRPGCN